MENKRPHECPACGKQLVDTGVTEFDPELEIKMRIYQCSACSEKFGIEIKKSDIESA